MKRKLLILLVLVVALFTVACSKDVKDGIVETQEESNVDVSESTPSVEENEEVEEDELVESLQWPTEFMENVPVLEGEIYKIRQDDENIVYISLKSINYEDALAYIEKLKEVGFTKDLDEYVLDSNINFKAIDEDGNFVKLHWSISGDTKIDMIKPEE